MINEKVDRQRLPGRDAPSQWVDPVAAALERIQQTTCPDRGDELRHQTEVLAYMAAMVHVEVLQRLENTLAATAGPAVPSAHDEGVVEIIRGHMVRGLFWAQRETGEHAIFWVKR